MHLSSICIRTILLLKGRNRFLHLHAFIPAPCNYPQYALSDTCPGDVSQLAKVLVVPRSWVQILSGMFGK